MFGKLFSRLFGKRPETVKAEPAPAHAPAAPEPAAPILDDLIARASDTRARDDRERVLDALKGRTLFMNLNRDAEGRMAIRSATLDGGLRPIVLYAADNHPDLDKPTGRIVWEVALGMVAQMPDTAGILLQSRGSGWIAIDRKGAAAILARK